MRRSNRLKEKAFSPKMLNLTCSTVVIEIVLDQTINLVETLVELTNYTQQISIKLPVITTTLA